MKTTKVHILASCRNPELLRGTTFVFDTIRTGFPTAEIVVHPNGLEGRAAEVVFQTIERHNFTIGCTEPTVHHKWIEHLATSEREPFWICDTDIVFWRSLEDFGFGGAAIAGRYIPQFYCDFTKCLTRPRLHTSLLWIDPEALQRELANYSANFPLSPFGHQIHLFAPFQYSMRGRDGQRVDYFHDSCSALYHAIGGFHFTQEHLDCFDHLNCGTWVDIAAPHLTRARELRREHELIYANPALARGFWRQQQKYFEHFAR